jgi:DNA (cytosine-5)-methyltransferase 1
MNELALFAGAGGGILGGHLLGWRTVCAVEWEPYPASVLCARQNDGFLPPFPIWDDVQTFDGKPWQGIVDVVSGGFSCQDISSAGGGAGITGSRSSMWKHMARIIGEVRPQYAFIENSPMLTIRGLETVLCDLAALGFNARWGVVSAADVGAPHLRERIWIVAHSINGGHREEVGRFDEAEAGIPKEHREEWGGRGMLVGAGNLERNRPADRLYDSGEVIPDASSAGLQGGKEARNDGVDGAQSRNKQSAGRGGIQKPRWPIEPNVGRVLSHGVAARMDRLKAIGNGQVPRVAATAWRLLK